MTAATEAESPLPPLREDLRITPGAPFLSGAPSWVIYDQVRHRYFQIGQRAAEIIARWSTGTLGKLKSRLLSERAIRMGDDEFAQLLQFLRNNSLLAADQAGTARSFTAMAERSRSSLLKWAMFKYVFFRVPLLRPNAFLSASWPFVRPLFSAGFVWLTAVFLVLGLYLASRQLSDLESHFRASLVWSSVATYAGAIIFVKILHELGHGYQAVSRGLRVPVMGVAFLVMFPLLYTDVTDAWRLRSRRDRIMIDSGGVLVELAIAVYATLAWCFLPDGAMRSAAFAIATTSWFFSLLVNLNPLMRFDGYYLLSDAVGIQNLQPRAFAMGKWGLRRLLFGLDTPPPERVTRGTRRFMSLYSYAVWIYRFFLFLGIALLVYAVVFKALGIVLFLVEIFFFIGRPILNEFAAWYEMRGAILRSGQTWVTIAILGAALTTFLWPMPSRIYAPAILEESRQQLLFPPIDARLEQVFVAEGDAVETGDPLFRFSDAELPLEIRQTETRIETYQLRLVSAAGDEVERAERLIVERLLEQETETLSALRDRENNLLVRASGPGHVRDLLPNLIEGRWLSRKQLLGRIVTPGRPFVRGFVREADVDRLDTGRSGHFFADELALRKVPLGPVELADFSVETLPDGYLTAPNGGVIPVAPSAESELVPLAEWYPFVASIEAGTVDTGAVQRGIVVLHREPEALARRVWRRIAQVLIREASF